ncbi:MAG: carbohydrate ABC transporter permease, partial [Anaerolineae bacterium]
MSNKLFTRKSIHEPSPFGKVVSYILLGLWTLVVLFPLYWLFVTSFKLPIDVNMGPFYIPFVDFQPSLHAWEYITVGDLSRDTWRPYLNTVIVATVSASLALVLGTAAAYGLTRFEYRPRVAAVLVFIGCLALGVVTVRLGVPWPIALVVGIALFVILLNTIAKRYGRSLGNADIAFWLISQRMLPPVAVVIPIYVFFQQLQLLDT